jgi:hypothetical protein
MMIYRDEGLSRCASMGLLKSPLVIVNRFVLSSRCSIEHGSSFSRFMRIRPS